ncbi:MAG TPA: hypothetical protein VLD37_00580 [Candidatus Bilamarchaeum sp.]|nr:hypothetical protein [Candidatus Bilamarchaeum sp.]
MMEYILAFVSGVLVKAVDWLDDDAKSRHPVKYALAASYGLFVGLIIGTASFGIIFLSALMAQVFSRKIDTTAHRIGFVVSILSLLYFGFGAIDIPLFSLFLLLAFLDEIDYVGPLRPLTDYRPFLKIGSLAMVMFGRLDYFGGIILFDIGYVLFEFAAGKVSKRKPEHRDPTV